MRVDQLIKPLTTLAAQYGQDKPVYTYGDFDDLEIGDLMTLLMGMLGMSTLRTYEKMKGVARESAK